MQVEKLTTVAVVYAAKGMLQVHRHCREENNMVTAVNSLTQHPGHNICTCKKPYEFRELY